MIITIAGKPGTGKTTIAKDVAKILGYQHLSGGDIRGEIAAKHNMTIDELNEVAKKEDWTDKEVDNSLVELGKTKDNYVIDSWTAFFFIPDSLKFFIDADPNVSAERIYKDQRPDEKHHDDVSGVKKMLLNRWNMCKKRWKEMYGFDIEDMSNYDVILDSSDKDKDEVTQEVLKYIRESEG